jgi:hypothetical protein
MNNEEAFFAGMYDGVTDVHVEAEQHDKMAQVFDAGLLDGVAAITEPSIMDKIAFLLDGEEVEETEEVVEEAPEAEKTASAILMDVIRGEGA